MSDTPRTDANESITCKEGDLCIAPDFARKLERELYEARAQLKAAYDALLYIATMPEYDRNDCYRLRNLGMEAASKLQPFIK